MEYIEEWAKEELFDIKKQKLEAVDKWTIENLQRLCALSFAPGYDSVPSFIKELGIRDKDYYELSMQNSKLPIVFPECAKQLQDWVNSYWKPIYLTKKGDISKKSIPLFKIDKAYKKEWKYYIYTSEWYLLSVNISDFENKWLKASTLSFVWIQLPYWDVFGKTCKKIISNNAKFESWNDWFIHAYSWAQYDEHEYQFPWDEVFQIDSSSILISEWWMLHQYKNGAWYKKMEVYDVPFKWIKQMFVDKKKNFLFVVNETEDWSKLHIINFYDFSKNKQINEIYQINDVTDVVWIDEKWWFFCKTSNWNIDYYWSTIENFRTNFFVGDEDKIPWKLIYPKEAKVTELNDNWKNVLLKSLENWEISISLDDDTEDETDKLDNSIIEKIWELEFDINWSKTSLKDLFNSATDEKSITIVYHIFEKIKKNPDIIKYEWVLKWMERKIVEKKNKIILESIFSELDNLAEKLWTSSDIATLITIQDRLKDIKKKRKNIQAWIVKQDKDLDDLLNLVNDRIKDYQEEHKDEYQEVVDDNLDRISEILKDIRNAIDISSIYENPIYESTRKLIISMDAETRDTYNKKLKDLINKRRDEIRAESVKQKKDEQDRVEKLKRDIEDDIDQVKETLEDIENIEAIEQFKESDAFVQQIKESLKEIPSTDAQKLDLKLDRIFSERIFKLRLWAEESKWVIQNLDAYWIDTALYYNEDWSEKIEWKISWDEKADWKISLIVKIMNWETHEYNKTLYLSDAEKFEDVLIRDYPIKFEMTTDEFRIFNKKLSRWKKSWKEELNNLVKRYHDEKHQEEKARLLKELNDMKEYYKDARYTELFIQRLIKEQKLNPRSKVPPYDPDYIVLDEEKEILKTLSARLADQKQNSWIEILEWWPWLWKTVMCEFLANVTNREIIRVQCSKMDPNDMFFAPTLKKNNSSYEQADWVRLMQKPGTIILFDEIDKLNDQCFERLHSLFDRSRSVYHWHLWTIKANPDCLFLWTRNSYDRLSNPILSRWRILQINYPWELNEAFKISKYTANPVLKKMSYEEFEMLYDKYVTRWEMAPSSAQEKTIYDLVININHLLNIFNSLRELYSSDTPFAFELSYRDARQIFVDYNSKWDFKSALESVLIPKARWAVVDPEEKKEQEEMVRDAISNEMW